MKKILIYSMLMLTAAQAMAQRSEILLQEDWEFKRGHEADNKEEWQKVKIPHDWAIYGPFDINNDLQVVAVEQNGEKEKTLKTGRTGGLPFIGNGTYRRTFEVADTTNKAITLVFDGAMSHAHVKVNGKEVVYWPYGYNSFYANINGVAVPGKNSLVVELENKNEQSRWYAGAGLYRNVHLITTNKIHVPTWGTYITTPYVSKEYASVKLNVSVKGAADFQKINVCTDIKDATGNVVATNHSTYVARGQEEVQNFIVNTPELWSPEHPYLYTATTRLVVDGNEVDCYNTRFGIRRLEYIPEKGFFLNDELTKFKGVCNHHDLGPLGTAINTAALRHQIELLKDMGANAIRTSHNMPAPELVRLCDEMGMMMMIEPFDDWGMWPKSKNGYGAIFKEWAERDIINMVQQYRNNPSVVMWSIGNEVPSQGAKEGMGELLMLQNLVHKLDPTRPVTCGMDRWPNVIKNGFAAALDIPGLNYRTQYYQQAYKELPQKIILGSETASTVSSRGEYFWPVTYQYRKQVYHPNNQSNSYDNESCSWSNVPDEDFQLEDDNEWMIGQFVWTGFDYLGEPSPYDTNAWPSHSSVFGIIDLASLPKDRFYLYRSKWNTKEHTLHILPHWTHPGREGEVTPIYIYTDYPEVELFVNGKSQGKERKLTRTEFEQCNDPLALQRRYRLIWNDVVYMPGEIKAVAYNADGTKAEEKIIRTAGKPHHLVLTANNTSLEANGEDLAYITVQVVDKDGNPCPTDNRRVNFSVKGNGSFRATANGDPTCIDLFHLPTMPLFNGALTAIVQSDKTSGEIIFEAKAKGVKPAKIVLKVKE